jgi:peroxiredoxin
MDKEKLNWRSIADRSVISAKWAARDTPTHYLIDHKGVIRYKWVGGPGEKAIDTALEKLIQEAEEKARETPK